MERFWNVESCTTAPALSGEEALCEKHFQSTVQRDQDGRFIVRLPVKENINKLGESKDTATNRLNQVERSLSKNPTKKQMYQEFMTEYEQLGHMELVHESHPVPSSELTCYLPHHGVVREDALTTKLRVVFDASCKTSSGLSLNDVLMTGPVVQEELFSILLRFRLHHYAFTADIEKMYRQIQVHPLDQPLQRILWRERPDKPIRIYQLKTVTYGTTSAPFLATRCLQQLALDEKERFPHASETALRDFYVDDLLTGADTIEEARKLQQQLSEMLMEGGFRLHKWGASCPQLLPQPSGKVVGIHELGATSGPMIKSLGLRWHTTDDVFQININSSRETEPITKRTVLSSIARIYDPLGLEAPVVLKAKTLMQKLWQLNIGWDDPIPDAFHGMWLTFRQQLSQLHDLRIPRKVVSVINSTIGLQGFSDASETAYGACVYIVELSAGHITNRALLCAKSRVAPLKGTTLPRLELCAALLLARLMQRVREALHRQVKDIVCHSDSEIVLAWLKAPASRWKTFVANRVAEIQELTSDCTWRHVKGELNPADHVSRGLDPHEILHCTLWWEGPGLTAEPCREEPIASDSVTTDINDLPEQRRTMTFLATSEPFNIINQYSSFNKLQRVTAYCLRFLHNARHKSPDRRSGPLGAEELKQASNTLIRSTQAETFGAELQALRSGHPVSRKSKILQLCPFIDSEGILRVGGRLGASQLPYAQRHPILLPEHTLTKLIIKQEHLRQLHAGPQSLLASIRQRYWPLSGRKIVRQVVHQCMTCFKVAPQQAHQLMGNLPTLRATPARPFLHVGIDFCGPVYIRPSRKRGVQAVKAYIVVFVCFVTRAIHLELAGDMTTETFIGALRRFIARRGQCAVIVSDNATTFTGAQRELGELRRLFEASQDQEKLHQFTAQEGIQWKFIPARSPHFGGLWEAGVKSTKFHLKRIIGNVHLTFEEMTTCLAQIEACLNSRPLTPLSSDPNDLAALTPGHFLVGGQMTAPVEPDLTHIAEGRLSRWQLLQQLIQNFWKRWSKEYLHTLQQRAKWNHPAPNLKVDSLVLLKEDNLHPLQWKLGRVIEVHPGSDGLVRVATVRVASGKVKRAVAKLCPLPIEK